VSNPRIRVLAVKKAEHSDEIIVRMVELDGKPQPEVTVSFAAPITEAREVNGQEQPIGPATLSNGALRTSFGGYQPRTFALRIAPPVQQVEAVRSTPVTLQYDLATASNDGQPSAAGFDGKGDALPAEMLPGQIDFHGVSFQLAPAKTGSSNAVVAKGQTVDFPSGNYNRVYVIAAAVDGDQKSEFEVADKKVELNIQDWGGFIGQWDDRQWDPADISRDHYGKMIGLKPGFIKRADIAWFASHHHDSAGQNVDYAYSYLFAYAIDLPKTAKSIKLPNNDHVRILAISVAEENPKVKPTRPLYDVLPVVAAQRDAH
jgi:alpha-mannosidase